MWHADAAEVLHEDAVPLRAHGAGNRRNVQLRKRLLQQADAGAVIGGLGPQQPDDCVGGRREGGELDRDFAGLRRGELVTVLATHLQRPAERLVGVLRRIADAAAAGGKDGGAGDREGGKDTHTAHLT